MKALILTCNTGEGHNSASAAIRDACAQREIPCDTADALSFLSPRISDFICSWHTRIYRYLPRLFGSGYGYAENHPSIFDDRRWAYRYLASGVEKLKALLQENEYDTIICVHVFSALMVSELLRREEVSALTAFIATDYTCSPITGDTNLDLYFIPHRDLVPEFCSNGLPEEKLIPSGIPVRSEFYNHPNRSAAKAALHLPSDCRQILLMCGSMGCGPMEELAERLSAALPTDAELTVICGTNDRLADSLEKKTLSGVRVLRYTREIALWLAASDIFLTKPGGLSTTEAAASGTPILFLDTVGGCETRNRIFFTSHDWADNADSAAEMVTRCLALLQNPQKLTLRTAKLRQAFSENAAQQIVNLLDDRSSVQSGANTFSLQEP